MTGDLFTGGDPSGIVSITPRVLRCEECGVTADAASVGLPATALHKPQLVHLLSGLHFHSQPWPDDRTDNPRLCRACRVARGCHCWNCGRDRTHLATTTTPTTKGTPA